MASRTGHEQFTAPSQPNQRRYEALRAYFVEGASAAQVAERLGYTRASVETLVRDYRHGRLELFGSSRPGPTSQPKKDAARELAIELRRGRHGLDEIVSELKRAGTPLSRTAVWEILTEAGLARMPKPAATTPATPAPERLAAEKVHVLSAEQWPREGAISTAHAGLFLLIPELLALDLPGLVTAAGWPSTEQLEALRSVLSLLALKLAGRRRRSHVKDIVHDPALGLFAGLNVLPKTWHLSTYSYRTERSQQLAFFKALQPALRNAGLLGDSGLNLDFHTIMSYGQDTILDKHYVPRRSQRTRSVLTFIAQDGEQRTILYANAELTAREQSGEVIEFVRFYEQTHGNLPKLLVFDQKLTTHEHLAELDELGVGFITLRQRSPKLTATLDALDKDAWTKTRLERPGKHTNVTYHEDPVTIKGHSFRQIAVNGLGRETATLILTNQQQLTVKQLIERYVQRWGIENHLAEQIRAFTSTRSAPKSRSPSTSTSRSRFSPTSPTEHSQNACTPPTTTRPPTRSAATSPTASASCASPPTTSKSASNAARTPPRSSTPATKTAASKSPGGTDEPSATASPPDPEN